MQTHTATPLTQHSVGLDDPWLTLEDAARRAACHVSTLRRLIKAGLLRHARVGPAKKAIRVRASWLDRALESSTQPLETA